MSSYQSTLRLILPALKTLAEVGLFWHEVDLTLSPSHCKVVRGEQNTERMEHAVYFGVPQNRVLFTLYQLVGCLVVPRTHTHTHMHTHTHTEPIEQIKHWKPPVVASPIAVPVSWVDRVLMVFGCPSKAGSH